MPSSPITPFQSVLSQSKIIAFLSLPVFLKKTVSIAAT